jgi:hypothetical protein
MSVKVDLLPAADPFQWKLPAAPVLMVNSADSFVTPCVQKGAVSSA